ncbi:oligosaccharide flippase family protein [Scandinavium manionii]|uniref:oligosaccharide flippase family protein n=1 Tax=Scandinavium manionii TaxID=2926520 RepID=UPI002164F6A5|nr:oligosaccharide flippase family protein [Scandinavium manionii]MCS2168274.1 oligosaccharide flippase family protein [Scandinavium manionii]
MSLKKNITGLAIAQIFGYVIPLLQFPYLSRIVGQDHFGLIIFTISLSQIAMILTDYGFDLSISRMIARGHKKNKILGIYLYQTTIIKTIILILAIFLIALIAYISGNYKNERVLFVCLILSIVFNTYNTRWLFQGIEKIYIYSRTMIFSRTLSLIIVGVLIKKADDYYWYGIALVIQSAMLTIICLIILKHWKIKFIPVRFSSVRAQMKDGFSFFLSRVSVSLYSSGCSVFLGTFGNNLNQVAIYGVAEQLYKAGVQVFSPVITALTPYMIRTKNYKLFFKINKLAFLVVVCGMFVGVVFGDLIIKTIFGPGYEGAHEVLNIFMVIIFASVFGMLFGYPALMPLGKERNANISVFISGILQIIMLLIIYYGSIPITAIAVASSYLVCDWVMFIFRLSVFINNYKVVRCEKK